MNLFSTDPRDIRKFGWTALLFFGSLAAVAIWRGKPVFTGFFGALAFLGLLFFLAPVAMKPAYLFWLRWGHIIGRGITIVLLTLIYYLVMTPYGIAMRLMGKRPLPYKPDRERASYWVRRTEPAQPKFRFFKRY